MSFNPNGPRNTPGTGTTGTTGGSMGGGMGRTGLESSPSRTIPIEETTEETSEGLRSKAAHLASDVKEKAAHLGSMVSDKAGAAVSTVGEKMEGMANVLREKAPTSVAPYAERAADTLERAGSYLREQDFGDFMDDVTGIIRRHPLPAMLTGVAIGFLLARNTRR